MRDKNCLQCARSRGLKTSPSGIAHLRRLQHQHVTIHKVFLSDISVHHPLFDTIPISLQRHKKIILRPQARIGRPKLHCPARRYVPGLDQIHESNQVRSTDYALPSLKRRNIRDESRLNKREAAILSISRCQYTWIPCQRILCSISSNISPSHR